MSKKNHIPIKSYYYVDEAGDGTLFNRRGKVIVGSKGCSSYFMMGLLKVPNPLDLSQKLETLRKTLVEDPYFKKVPSMQPASNKTAKAFHAKDDIPEVRKEVYSLLKKETNLEFYAVIKKKSIVVNDVKHRGKKGKKYHYHPNQLYDLLVQKLFKRRLHQVGEYNIVFSKRGNTERTKALKQALNIAQKRSNAKASVKPKSLMNIETLSPKQHSGLQAVDYFLWALQRFYERCEDRYLEYLWPTYKCVLDIDDVRVRGYGKYYTQKEPLTISVAQLDCI